MLPNPLIVTMKDASPGEMLPRIRSGEVKVKLVSKDGKEINDNNSILECEDGFTKNLDSKLSASFSLLIRESSDGSQYRLLFIINYLVESIGPCQETILSLPFTVYSSKLKKQPGKPSVMALKYIETTGHEEVEVWIKGKEFCENVEVRFDGICGRVVECTNNLITVFAPIRSDLEVDTQVEVMVANVFGEKIYLADERLKFTYSLSKQKLVS